MADAENAGQTHYLERAIMSDKELAEYLRKKDILYNFQFRPDARRPATCSWFNALGEEEVIVLYEYTGASCTPILYVRKNDG